MAFILVAEDSPELCEVYQQHLENAGHRVETAQNGLTALTTALKLVPDLILMDLEMPEMDGIQALTSLKHDSHYQAIRHIPVVLLSCHTLPSQIHQGFQAGCDAYIIKPLDPREIIEELALLLHSPEFATFSLDRRSVNT